MAVWMVAYLELKMVVMMGFEKAALLVQKMVAQMVDVKAESRDVW